MKHFLFYDYETEENFIVCAETLNNARDIAESFFDKPEYEEIELSDWEAESSGFDEY